MQLNKSILIAAMVGKCLPTLAFASTGNSVLIPSDSKGGFLYIERVRLATMLEDDRKTALDSLSHNGKAAIVSDKRAVRGVFSKIRPGFGSLRPRRVNVQFATLKPEQGHHSFGELLVADMFIEKNMLLLEAPKSYPVNKLESTANAGKWAQDYGGLAWILQAPLQTLATRPPRRTDKPECVIPEPEASTWETMGQYRNTEGFRTFGHRASSKTGRVKVKVMAYSKKQKGDVPVGNKNLVAKSEVTFAGEVKANGNISRIELYPDSYDQIRGTGIFTRKVTKPLGTPITSWEETQGALTKTIPTSIKASFPFGTMKPSTTQVRLLQDVPDLEASVSIEYTYSRNWTASTSYKNTRVEYFGYAENSYEEIHEYSLKLGLKAGLGGGVEGEVSAAFYVLHGVGSAEGNRDFDTHCLDNWNVQNYSNTGYDFFELGFKQEVKLKIGGTVEFTVDFRQPIKRDYKPGIFTVDRGYIAAVQEQIDVLQENPNWLELDNRM